MKSSIRTSLLTLVLLPALGAHDLYLLPSAFRVDKGASLGIAFHNGDSFPESEVAPLLARLRDAHVTGQAGTAPVTNLRIVGKETIGEARIPGSGNLLVSVSTVPNFLSLAPDKFLEYLKEESLTDVIAWREKHGETSKPSRERYTKFAKSLVQSGASDDFYRHSLDFPIEIIPFADPSTVHAGGTLPVQVMLRGKPAAGIPVESAWTSQGKSKTTLIGRTGADGRISVPIAQPGRFRLHSLHMERCAEPAVADWESLWASLTFEIR
jgi:hypothetical protein